MNKFMRGKDRKLRKGVLDGVFIQLYLDGVFIQLYYICVSSGTEIWRKRKILAFKCLNLAVENYSNNRIQ